LVLPSSVWGQRSRKGNHQRPSRWNPLYLAVTTTTTTIRKKERKHFECGLYIAESTIPNAGLGIFTATAKKPLDPIGSGDVCIPNIDINYHNPLPVFDPFQAYYWKGSSMGMSRESHSNDVEAFCPGVDSAINCNLALINTHKSHPTYDYAQFHRSRNPGAGALTPYHNGTTHAANNV
jgi:hypothetical protein